MKILNYASYVVIGILVILLFQQCTSKKKEITELTTQVQELLEQNSFNKEKYYEVKQKLDSCLLSPAKDIVRIKYVNNTVHDTVYIDTTDSLLTYQPIPKEQVEVIETYHSDSLYKVTSGIRFQGKLLDFNQMMEFTRTPTLPTIDSYIENTTILKVNTVSKVRYPRIFVTSGFEWVQLENLQKLDYNVGLTLLDNKFRIFQLRKSITCTTCGSIDFGVPLIFNKR